jgi:hypothetical protein
MNNLELFGRLQLSKKMNTSDEYKNILISLVDFTDRLLMKITTQEVNELQWGGSNYEEYYRGTLANHTTIVSPEHIDNNGTRYRLQVRLAGCMLIAVANEWNRKFTDSIDPWTLVLRIAMRGAFRNTNPGSMLEMPHLRHIAEELDCRFQVTIPRTGITAGIEADNVVVVGNASSPHKIPLRLHGNHFRTGHELGFPHWT